MDSVSFIDVSSWTPVWSFVGLPFQPALSNLGKLPQAFRIAFPASISPLGWLPPGTEHSLAFSGVLAGLLQVKGICCFTPNPHPHTFTVTFFFLTKINTIIWKSWSGPDPSSNMLFPLKGQPPSSARSQSACAYFRFLVCSSGAYIAVLACWQVWSRAWGGGEQHVSVGSSSVLISALASVYPWSFPKQRQFSRSIFDERLPPILHSGVIFSISGSEGKCLAKA